MKVKDVMHTGVVSVSPDARLAQIARKMRDEDIGAVPVVENDHLIGMVTDRDITCRGLADGHDIARLTARDVMSMPLLWCRSEDDVAAAIHLMEESKIRRLPVLNEKKHMVGMLTLGDISQKVSRATAGEAIQSLSAHHP